MSLLFRLYHLIKAVTMKDLFLTGRAVAFRECGKSFGWISRHLGVGSTSVKRWYSSFLHTGTVSKRKSTGRPLRTTARSNRLLRRIVNLNRFSNSSLIRRMWDEPVSLWTVRRRIHNFGFKRYRCPIKPFLSDVKREARFRWAQNHSFWPVERFHRVVWSDESRFRLFVNDGRIKVWRQRGERFREDLIKRGSQAGGGSVHVWGAIWFGGRSSLQILVRSVTGASYCDILRTFLNSNRLPPPGWRFQQDNAPAHRSQIVNNFLREHAIPLLDWPSKSPDLNPIEHVWDYLGRKVQERSPTDLLNLAGIVSEEWECMPQEFIDNLVNSMRRRIGAVIERTGGSTRY